MDPNEIITLTRKFVQDLDLNGPDEITTILDEARRQGFTLEWSEEGPWSLVKTIEPLRATIDRAPAEEGGNLRIAIGLATGKGPALICYRYNASDVADTIVTTAFADALQALETVLYLTETSELSTPATARTLRPAPVQDPVWTLTVNERKAELAKLETTLADLTIETIETRHRMDELIHWIGLEEELTETRRALDKLRSQRTNN